MLASLASRLGLGGAASMLASLASRQPNCLDTLEGAGPSAPLFLFERFISCLWLLPSMLASLASRLGLRWQPPLGDGYFVRMNVLASAALWRSSALPCLIASSSTSSD